MGGGVLMEYALGDRLIDLFHRNLVSTLGPGAVTFDGGGLEFLDGGSHVGFPGTVPGVTRFPNEVAFFGRLNIRQCVHPPSVTLSYRGLL